MWEFDAFVDYCNWMLGVQWDAKLGIVIVSLGPLVLLANRP